MKTKLRVSLAATLVAAGLIVACNKQNSRSDSNNNGDSNSPNTTTAQVQTQADDESQVNTELNAAEDDINSSLNTSAAFSGTTTNEAGAGVQTDGGGGLHILYNLC